MPPGEDEVRIPWSQAVELIASRAADQAARIALREAVEVSRTLITEHQQNCPVKSEVKVQWWKLVALMLAAGGSGGTLAVIARAVMAAL
jgi:hypothetical protein